MESAELTQDRKLKLQLAHGIMLAVVFAIAACKVTKTSAIAALIATCLVTSVFVMILVLCDVTLRLCQTLVSLVDVDQQSGESFTSLVSLNFALNTASATVVVIGTLLFLGLVVVIRQCPLNYVWDFGPYVCVLSMTFAFCLLRTVDLAEWQTRSSPAQLSSMNGLDYGTGMAYSYYYGYLRAVLSSTGLADSRGIVEQIENLENTRNVTFPVHKMFILIPLSGNVPSDLKDASDQWMQRAREFEEETRNRTDIMGRRYRDNVYKIYPDGQALRDPMYVMVEGATPLLTYCEVQRHNHPESTVYQRHNREIIEMFYRKLLEILQSEPDTRDLCELIYYDDVQHGARVNVAKIILERISRMESYA